MTRLRRLLAYVGSRQGKHDIGTLIAAAVAVYTSLKAAGVF